MVPCLLLLWIFALSTILNLCRADDSSNIYTYVPLENGANSLFIGHSFFIPVAVIFDRLVQQTQDSFPDHGFQTVARSGEGGSPSRLWEDQGSRAEVDGVLMEGNIDILGMTVFNLDKSETDYHQRWINLALSYNPNTVVFIGSPWPIGGSYTATESISGTVTMLSQIIQTNIERLRSQNPGIPILLIQYGKASPVMKQKFEEGTLPDITRLVGSSRDSLYNDNFLGHAGMMMTEMCALTWLSILYGVPQEESITQYASSDWDVESVRNITTQLLEFNEKFMTREVVPTFSPSAQPTTTMMPSSGVTIAEGFDESIHCFSGNSKVKVKGNGDVPLEAIKIGDLVLVAPNRYERIYSFGHRKQASATPKQEITYLRFLPSGIEISPNHLIQVWGEGYLRAAYVKVGDSLLDGTHAPQVVTFIQSVTRDSAFAPFTRSGRIMVNGVQASTYAMISEVSDNQFPPFVASNYHLLAFLFQAPHRLYCQLWECSDETYTEEGLSLWVAQSSKVASSLSKQPYKLQYLVLSLVIPALVTLFILEKLVTFSCSVSALFFVGGILATLFPGFLGAFQIKNKQRN